MKEFGKEGYKATVSKLSNNLIGIDTVEMLEKLRVTSDVYANALSSYAVYTFGFGGFYPPATCILIKGS